MIFFLTKKHPVVQELVESRKQQHEKVKMMLFRKNLDTMAFDLNKHHNVTHTEFNPFIIGLHPTKAGSKHEVGQNPQALGQEE